MRAACVRREVNEVEHTRGVDSDAAGMWLENSYSALFTAQELGAPGKAMSGKFISRCIPEPHNPCLCKLTTFPGGQL